LYPIFTQNSLLYDICNDDRTVQIAVLTTQYKQMHQIYKWEVNVQFHLQKRKTEAQEQLS